VEAGGTGLRRTQLAAERTWLAWWRTGLAAAVAGLAVGRILPEIVGGTTWPYVVLGCGYVVLAPAFFVAGARRQLAVRTALRESSYEELGDRWVVVFTVAGVLLTLVTLVVVAVGSS
jgi:putative membrane protein